MNTTQLSKLQDMVANYHNTNVGQLMRRKQPLSPQDNAKLVNPLFQGQMQGSAQVLPQGPNRLPGGDNINPMQQGLHLGQPRPGMHPGPGGMPIMNTPSSAAMQMVKSKFLPAWLQGALFPQNPVHGRPPTHPGGPVTQPGGPGQQPYPIPDAPVHGRPKTTTPMPPPTGQMAQDYTGPNPGMMQATAAPGVHPTHQQFLQSAIGAGFSPDLVMQFLTHKIGLNNPNGGK